MVVTLKVMVSCGGQPQSGVALFIYAGAWCKLAFGLDLKAQKKIFVKNVQEIPNFYFRNKRLAFQSYAWVNTSAIYNHKFPLSLNEILNVIKLLLMF